MRSEDIVPGAATREARRFAALPSRELDLLMLRGETPDVGALAGWDFRGLNTPRYADLLRIRKFVKGFWKDGDGRVWGYNKPVAQDGPARPWVTTGKPFGFYSVTAVDAGDRDNAFLHALLLDYGAGPNRTIDPSRALRDYVVRVERGSDDMLLGKAYVALGPARVPVSWFILERSKPNDFRGK